MDEMRQRLVPMSPGTQELVDQFLGSNAKSPHDHVGLVVSSVFAER